MSFFMPSPVASSTYLSAPVSVLGDDEFGTAHGTTVETLLNRCFFIYDKTASNREEDDPKDKIVFFYPSEVPIESQIFMVGACTAMTEFAKNFTDSFPQTLTMDKHKITLLEVGVLTLALTSTLAYPDAALIQDLQHIYGAFKFLFGSFDHIKNNTDGEHQQFLDIMKELGREIVPFVRRYEKLSFSSFDPINYTQLPPNQNRLFLASSEILASLKSEPDNLGGCILYQDTVLCSHLEPTTTYYILTRIQSMNDPSYDATGAAPSSGSGSASAGPNSAGSGAAGPGSAGDVNRPNSTVCHAVFLPKNQIAALREGREPVIQAADDLKNQLPQGYFSKTDEGEFVGLFILFLSKITLAVVMNLPAMYDERHNSKTRSLVHSKLFSLESKLVKSVSRVATERPPTLPFNYMTYDGTTHRVQTLPQETLSEADARFRFGTRTMHEIFASNPDVNHVMLRDHTGPLLARRIFQRETYYQHRFVAPVAITGVPMSSAAAQSSTLGGGRASIVAKDLGRLEDVARDNLQDLAVPLL